MSVRQESIRPGQKAIITNTGSTDVKVWTGTPPKEYCTLRPGECEQVFNTSDSEDLPVRYENNGGTKIDHTDFDDC